MKDHKGFDIPEGFEFLTIFRLFFAEVEVGGLYPSHPRSRGGEGNKMQCWLSLPGRRHP